MSPLRTRLAVPKRTKGSTRTPLRIRSALRATSEGEAEKRANALQGRALSRTAWPVSSYSSRALSLKRNLLGSGAAAVGGAGLLASPQPPPEEPRGMPDYPESLFAQIRTPKKTRIAN